MDMDTDVDFGEEEGMEDMVPNSSMDPDEFLAKNTFRIIYQTNNFFLPQIRELVEKGETINLRPEYQRRLRWTNAQKSRLIESLLLNIPIPPVFFYEADAARYEVMDGQQRLNAIRDFFAGDYALSGLKYLSPLNGIRYTKCPPKVKRTLERASISAIVLLMESEAEISAQGTPSSTDLRRLVFDRLNTGGRQLNAQEIRNALNPGHFNKAVIHLSRYNLFTDVFGIPAYTEQGEEAFYENPHRQKNNLYSSMKDCELILRFFALRDPNNIKGSMRSMLDRTMEAPLGENEAEQAKQSYKDCFSFLYYLFDQKPFHIEVERKTKISAALYDALMVAMDILWEHKDTIQADKAGVISRLEKSISDEKTYPLIVGRKNTAEAVKQRIIIAQNILLPKE